MQVANFHCMDRSINYLVPHQVMWIGALHYSSSTAKTLAFNFQDPKLSLRPKTPQNFDSRNKVFVY